MRWVYATLVAATAFTVLYLVANWVMQETSSLAYATVYSVLSALLYAPVALRFRPETLGLTPAAVGALLVSGVANAGGVVSLNRAIKTGEVSTVAPLVRTQPVWTAVVGVAVLGESAGLGKLAGVCLVTVGGYVVLLRPDHAPTDPLRRLRADAAPRLGLLAGALFAVGAVADRFATRTVPPRLYTFLLLALIATGVSAYVVAGSDETVGSVRASFRRHRLAYLAVGVCSALAYFSFVTALSLAEASRAVPVLQVQVLLTVLGGYLLFDERGVGRKLVGSTLLLAGVVLVVDPTLG